MNCLEVRSFTVKGNVNIFAKIAHVQQNFSGSNTDGSFTTAVSSSFLSP